MHLQEVHLLPLFSSKDEAWYDTIQFIMDPGVM